MLRRQRDLIADWQAQELGVAPRALHRACLNGWQRHGFHVFSDRDGDPSEAQMRVIAVLESGPGSMLTGRAALAECGWKPGQGDHVDVLVPRALRGRRHPDLPWLRVHTTTTPMPAAHGLPPRVDLPIAAIDAAMWARSAREVLLILVSCAQQGLSSPARLDREIGRRRLLRNRRWIDEAMRELMEGAQSTTEADFLRECRRRGLIRPRMQTRRMDAWGRNRRTDAEFRLADGRLIVVEIDGAGHMSVDQWHADIARHNGLAATTGGITLRVTGWEVRNDPDPFFDLLTALIDGVVIPTAI